MDLNPCFTHVLAKKNFQTLTYNTCRSYCASIGVNMIRFGAMETCFMQYFAFCQHPLR